MFFKKFFLIFFGLILISTPLPAQHGGLGLKFNFPTYHFENHPDVTKSFNSLYLSFRMGKGISLFADSYLLKTNGEPFTTGLTPPMKQSHFSDQVTVLGLKYHQKLPLLPLAAFVGAGFGWHALRIGHAENSIKETVKNHAGHAVLGLEYDLEFIPVVVFAEGRYARIFLREENANPKFSPSALHAGGYITLTSLSIGTLIYFF
jgi:hypothetical protein